jgi:hypothetical protein
MFFSLEDSKPRKKHLLLDTDVSPQLDHVMRVFRAYEQATTSSTVRGSWEKACFVFTQRSGTYYLWVDEAKIRKISEFSEVWEIDYREGRLSAVRRRQRRGWLNEARFRLEFIDLARAETLHE